MIALAEVPHRRSSKFPTRVVPPMKAASVDAGRCQPCQHCPDELGLAGYPKTSGGRGIHVFLRIATDWGFVEVRRAGIALAREVERRAPDAVTTSWWKEERGQRIFIDFNQNARDRTMASAYSVRATPIATVSTPLTWDELAGADPDDYTMATVPDLVKRRDDP
jgi:DNA primase